MRDVVAGRILEADVQQALWDTFEFPAARISVLEALLRLVPKVSAEAFRQNVTGRVWAWNVASGRFGPDLVLVDDDDEVLMVIELKIGAAENVLRASTVSRGVTRAERRGDLLTSSDARRVAEELGIHSSRHHAGHDGYDCECPWHTRTTVAADGSNRWVRVVSQFDAYLTFGWLHQGMRKVRPAQVPFLFLDSTGHAVTDSHRYAKFGDKWCSASFKAFLAAFEDAPPAHESEARLRALLARL